MKHQLLVGMLAALLLTLLLAGCASKTETRLQESARTAGVEAPTPAPTATLPPTPSPEPTPEPTPYGQFVWRGSTAEFFGYTDDRTLLQSASEQFGMPTDGKILFVILGERTDTSVKYTHELLEATKLIGPDGAEYSTGVSANDGTHVFLEFDIPADADPAAYTARILMDDGTEQLIPLSGLPVWTGEQP